MQYDIALWHPQSRCLYDGGNKVFFSETGKFADNLEDNKNIVTIQTILVIFVYESMCFFYCFCY